MAAVAVPRGPKGHLISGHLRELSREPLNFLQMCAREYGDFVPLKFGTKRAVFLNRPEFIEYVLVTNHRNFIKGPVVRGLRRLLGNGLVTSDGEFWLRQRRLTQPAFHRERVVAAGDALVRRTERMVATWPDGEVRELYRELARLTLANVAEVLFGADVGGEADAVAAALTTLAGEQSTAQVSSLLSLLPGWIPTPGNLRVRRAVRRLDGIIGGIISRRAASKERRDDLLAILLRAREEDPVVMTDRQLRDEALTFLLAGHDTTALALSWTWYLLAQHPEAEANLLAEVRATVGGRSPAVADLPRLKYADGVVSEALRLYPPSWALARVAIRDCELGGHPIPAGTIVLMSQWVMHRDPRYFDRPEAFDPDRWAGELSGRLPKCAYFPFGAGPRLCIGNLFAQMEANLLLATIAQRFHVVPVPSHPVTPRPDIVLRPERGVQVVLRRR
ncbi:MAG: cytochrome P450 [Chloroflexota bacterium]|nr:cytochrome P450 [Chloroflexota bacterium]